MIFVSFYLLLESANNILTLKTEKKYKNFDKMRKKITKIRTLNVCGSFFFKQKKGVCSKWKIANII